MGKGSFSQHGSDVAMINCGTSTEWGQNSGYVAELYQLYQSSPNAVSTEWRNFFEANKSIWSDLPVSAAPAPATTLGNVSGGRLLAMPEQKRVPLVEPGLVEKQVAVARLIEAYRAFGHHAADVVPLKHDVYQWPIPRELDLSNHGLDEGDDSQYLVGGFQGFHALTVAELLKKLRNVYCGSIGFEWSHVAQPKARAWLQERIEGQLGQLSETVSLEEQKRRLRWTLRSVLFEQELHKKYVGVKRFSLEGGEALLPMLETILVGASERGVLELVLGMAHRGRLNVLTEFMRRPLHELFLEFDDRSLQTAVGAGDVKYHFGYESVRVVGHENTKSIGLTLIPNPSHLEAVNPVVEGVVRAMQDRHWSGNRRVVLPVLIHGDAAFAGQGVVFETFNFSKVDGYTTGGTIHVIINNQIGYTATPEESRSTPYCTDFAKAVGIPVFHVNGEDVDAVCRVGKLAIDYRNEFGRDVIIDLNCYRKHGHNEGDDPSYTQPLSCKEIAQKQNVASIYLKRLAAIDPNIDKEVESIVDEYRADFVSSYNKSRESVVGEACHMYGRKRRLQAPSSALSYDRLDSIARSMVQYPDGFTPHPKLDNLMKKRVEACRVGNVVDWGLAEALAFGTLLQEGYSIRLSGQDSARGTFSHRHAVLTDYVDGSTKFLPLGSMVATMPNGRAQTFFEVVNSVLSEEAVLGFEFGYGTNLSHGLVLWEAQFGDFVNGAQIQIDQFISSSDSKWGQQSSVVLLLPHGYEGMGPEHSSARPERFLQLCAEENMEVCNPSNTHQYFAMLRRHAFRSFIMPRPLVVMTPKSLLRSREASSLYEKFIDDTFQDILVDKLGDGKSKTLILCSGKVYYDVMNKLVEENVVGATVVRLEQLYPLPEEALRKIIASEDELKSFMWVQEEPRNQGGWSFVNEFFLEQFDLRFSYVGRPASASTAVGSSAYSKMQLTNFLNDMVSKVA
jgi:2-oxoglutarate dehydrogenase E1 component